eukprot:TRINITY_DN1789_c0_g1_i1.p1 TRINITY_DN1789_c0_g1~~TRINITY_DN1789_c0_g1_i1.p1  ORF type:complete len:253 (+),score=59.11 TRINITY_DN1789_c0_g1_i1:169-927(+)
MADLFADYEEEFVDVKRQLEQHIRNMSGFEGADRRAELQDAEGDIKRLEDTLRQMNLIGRSNPRLAAKVKEYDQEVARLKAAVRKTGVQMVQSNDRADLLAGLRVNADKVMAASMDQRERLLSQNDRLEKLDDELDSTISIALDTVKVGEDTLNRMDQQTDQIRGFKGTLRDIEAQLGKANKIMKVMARRAWANKVILIVIALVLLAAIGIIIYVKYFSGGSHSGPASTTGTTGNSTTTTGTTGPTSTGGSI